jgi:hypothetical protein
MVIALLWFVTAAAPARAGETPPSSWWWYYGLDANGVTSKINEHGARIVSLSSYLSGGSRKFTVILQKNTGQAWWWYYGLSAQDLSKKIQESGGRIIDLQAYQDGSALKFNAVLLKDSSTAWWWYYGLDANALGQKLTQNNARLIDLDTYVENGVRKFAAVMVKNTGQAWWWYYGVTPDALAAKLQETGGRLVSLTPYEEGGTLKFAAVLLKDPGQAWWWYYGQSADALAKQIEAHCAWLVDLESYESNGARVFAAVMLQYPQTPAAGTAQLLQLTGSSSLNKVDPTGGESLSISLNLKNLTSQTVTIERADLLFASQGGWSWYVEDMIATSGKFHGAGPAIGASASLTLNASYGWSWPVSYVIYHLRATSGGATRDLVTTLPVKRAGYKDPPAFSAAAPLYIGMQAPLEVLPLASGKRWLTLIGQVVNLGGRPQTVSRLHARLTDSSGKVVQDGDLNVTFMQDTSSGETTDDMVDSTAPVPRFLKGIEVPASFTGGTLRLEVESRVDDHCLYLARDFTVAAASPISIRAPISSRWKWGNGPGETSLSAHSWPEHRYAYDLVVLKDGSTHSGDASTNANFYCWARPILAAADGTVVEVVDTVPDNYGTTFNTANTNKENSRVVVQHTTTDFSVYAHPRQGSAVVTVGQKVKAGDTLAHVGNAGQSSEPHLHFTYYRIDETGRLRALPVAPTGLTATSGAAVTGVPVGGVEYNAP